MIGLIFLTHPVPAETAHPRLNAHLGINENAHPRRQPMTSPLTRIIAAAAISASMIAGINQASAASLAVELACAADYYSYCSQHDPDGPGVRSCMRTNGPKLSNRCIKALVAAGEVSKSEVESRTASGR
jgi:hypothetical protein